MNVDELLTEAGERWRAAEPPPPEPDLTRFRTARPLRRTLIPLAAATTAAAAVFGGVLAGQAPGLHEGPPGALPAAPHGYAGPAAGRQGTLLAVDGTTVRATGLVAGRNGAAQVLFCPWLPWRVLSQAQGTDPGAVRCPGPSVTAVGVDLGLLQGRADAHGVVSGGAVLQGVYRDGSLQVTAQAAPTAVPAFGADEEPGPVPGCSEPAGGWPTGTADPARAAAYVASRPELFTGLQQLSPAAATGDPAALGGLVTVVGVLAGHERAERARLAGLVAGPLCVVPLAYSRADLDRAAPHLSRLAALGRVVSSFRPAGWSGAYRVSLTVLDPASYAELRQLPAGMVDVRVWLEPVR